jgi:iron(III) transport system permease protein
VTASAPVTETGSDRVETTAADRASRRGWPGGALVLAALVVVPIGFLAIGILDPETEVWRQQWDTRLPGQLVDTAVLLVGVSFGALFLGSSLAWLVSAYRFPGSKAFGWLLVAPLAMPSYVLGFVTMSVFGFTGPVQNQWRDWFGRDTWFPEVESMGGAIVVFTLVLYPYVFLLARAALTDQAGSAYNVARSLGARTGRGRASCRDPDASTSTCRRRGRRDDGDDHRLRDRPVFRRRHRDGRRLPHLARHLRS